jgi:DNA-binding XRE family transcriptional regulator
MLDYVRSLGDCFRKSRNELGLTQSQVAEKAGVDTRTVMNIENYKGNPKMEVLFPLIRTLQIDPWEVFYPELEQGSPAMRQLQLLLMESSEDEIEALLPICRAARDVLKAKEPITIE